MGQYFQLTKRRTRLSTEILGGLVTYMCLAYISAVKMKTKPATLRPL